MVDEVHTQNNLLAMFRYYYSLVTKASKVEHAASYKVGCWWLLAVVFVSAASAPHLGAFEAGDTLSE